MLLIEQNESFAPSFPSLKYCRERHSYATRSKNQKLFDIPNNKAETYGTQSTT